MLRVILARAGRAIVLITSLASLGRAEARMTPECKAALLAADRAVRKGDRAGARALLDDAARLGADAPAGGECLARVLSKRGELATLDGDHEAARRHQRQAAHRAVDVPALWRAFTKARVAAENRVGRRDRAERVAKLLTHEAAVAAYDRRPAVGKNGRSAAERAIDEAIQAFRVDRDGSRRAWATAVKAKVLAHTGDPGAARALAGALAEAAARRPELVRIAAHEALAIAARVEGHAEAEAKAMLWTDLLRGQQAGRTPEERWFARSRDTERACLRYEKTAGDGGCAALAMASLGEPSFRDPSRARPKRTVTRDEIEQAQRQYTPAIEACLRDAARAHADGELFENASITIGWSVGGDGRATEIEIQPRRYDASIGACVRTRVAWFRYPRATDGQVHSISLPFQLDVSERFGGRR